MRSKYITDYRHRNKYCKREAKLMVLRSLVYNSYLPFYARQQVLKSNIKFLTRRGGSIVRIKNRCVVSNRGRAVYGKLGLSRVKFRDYALKGFLYGVKKSSW